MQSVSNANCHFVAYRNGTGRVTFLQRTIPSLTCGSFDYISTHNDMSNAKQFKEILQKDKHSEDDYNTEDYLLIRENTVRELFDRHCVYAACKDQGGDEWRHMHVFTITSTL